MRRAPVMVNSSVERRGTVDLAAFDSEDQKMYILNRYLREYRGAAKALDSAESHP